MARILIGWELGAGRGHVVGMLAMTAALLGRGHQVALAVQRYAELPVTLPDVPIFQAPIWPGLLATGSRPPLRPASTMVDILGRLGLDRPRTLTHLLTGWDAIFAAWKPDLVIGDYAPALMVAAQARIHSIAAGSGFQVLPATEPVARLTGAEPGYDEAAMLDVIDADLREAGRPPLDHLGALFACSRPIVASFIELDPYRRSNPALFCAPPLAGWHAPAETRGDEVFVYVNDQLSNVEALWRGLHASGLPIRAYAPHVSPDIRRLLNTLRIGFEPQPIGWDAIARHSRVVVSLGGHGTICAALLAGLPHLAFYPDLEKALHARAVAGLGLGALCNADATTPDELGAAVRSLYHDEALAARARAAARGFQSRMSVPFGETIGDAVAELL